MDIDFGTYPFVTSSNTISAGTCTGMGVAPNKIERIIGILRPIVLEWVVDLFQLNLVMMWGQK